MKRGAVYTDHRDNLFLLATARRLNIDCLAGPRDSRDRLA